MDDDNSGLVLNLTTQTQANVQNKWTTGDIKGSNKSQKNSKQNRKQKFQHHDGPRKSHNLAPSSHRQDESGDSPGKSFSFNFSQSIQKSSGKREKGGQTREGDKPTGPPSNNVISSLFRHNPDIPQVHVQTVKQNKEAVFSSTGFSDLPLHPFMVSNLEKNLGFTQMTSIQQRAIPTLLQGSDTLVKSQTGTGKTLAYAVPVIQHLQGLQPKVQRSHGPYAVVLVPTRELALQSFDTLQKLVKPFQWMVPGCLMGGEKKKSEKARIRRGINVLVSTPGRLVDHINTTQSLTFERVKWVILDEADRLLDMGFEKDVSSILNAIKDQAKSHRQTVLVSATLSEGVKRLASISLNDPVFIDGAKNPAASSSSSESLLPKASLSEEMPSSESNSDQRTLSNHKQNEESSYEEQETFTVPERLKQRFVIVPSKLRLVTLTALVAGRFKSSSDSKMLVFLSSRESVEFHYTLFQSCLGCSTLTEEGTSSNKEGLPLFRLHGSMSQDDRTKMYHAFSDARKGLLMCTDVAARGLDLPKVRWIIQYNTPGSPSDYVHRVGRTARIGKEGHALLFLTPSEVEYVRVLEQQQIRITEQPLDDILRDLLTSEAQDFIHGQFKGQMQRSVEEAATSLQLRFESHILSDSANTQHARKAFHSFVRAYATYPSSVKHIFHIKKLHLGHAAKSFGLREAPANISNRIGSNANARGTKRKQSGGAMKSGGVSEFDSGLDSAELVVHNKKKQRKGSDELRKKQKPFQRKKF